MRPPNYPAETRPFIPLFWRLFLPNATVLAVASIILLVGPANGRLLVLVAGLAALLVSNLLLMRRASAPLAKLTALMAQVDPLRPGSRFELPGPASEVTLLSKSFNEMLERLEIERRDSVRRALAAQEEERRRLAAELHDEMGAVVLAIRDDGRGIDPEPAGQGGLRFMRERAISVGADLQIAARGGRGGTEVRPRLPAEGMSR